MRPDEEKQWIEHNPKTFSHQFQILYEVLIERVRVQAVEGHTIAKDDAGEPNSLIEGAAAYLLCEPSWWPYARDTFKASNESGHLDKPGRRRDLIKAMQMIMAEVERMDRAESNKS